MRKLPLLMLVIFTVARLAFAAAPATMRMDYFHTGKADQEIFSVDRVVIALAGESPSPDR